MSNSILKISKQIYEAVIAHAQSELPNESCGYFAGKDGQVSLFYPMTNIDASPEHFSFDPKEQFKVVKAAREQSLDLLAVYHSHPSTPARLSEEDIRLFNDPTPVYVIVSLSNPKPEMNGFNVFKPNANEVEIEKVIIEIN